MTARIFNTLLGTWLFLSAFAWPHTPAQGMVTMVCAALTVLTALVSIFRPRVRYLTRRSRSRCSWRRWRPHRR